MKDGCINFLPVEPAVFEAAFDIVLHHEEMMKRGNGDLYAVAPYYVENHGGDPADPSSYHQIPSTVVMVESGADAWEAEVAIARARSFIELLKGPNGTRYGVLVDNAYDIEPFTFSVAAEAPCCMGCGFDEERFNFSWKRAALLYAVPSGQVTGQVWQTPEVEWPI